MQRPQKRIHISHFTFFPFIYILEVDNNILKKLRVPIYLLSFSSRKSCPNLSHYSSAFDLNFPFLVHYPLILKTAPLSLKYTFYFQCNQIIEIKRGSR
jgi:hypothetical protein